MADVLVVGCGLIGTSIGLALAGSALPDVVLLDDAPHMLDVAVARGAGRAWDGQEKADLVVAAVPPTAIAELLRQLQGMDIAKTYTHVCSVQSQVQREVEALHCDLSTIVGGHPLAGRETSGPESATADLFLGRTWALCPSERSTPAALDGARQLAEACGAVPLQIVADAHDAAVALMSHLPQIAASALAGMLVPQPGSAAAAPAPASSVGAHDLSGPGLADTTRLAAGSADLWTEILTSNASYVAPHVRRLGDDLHQLATTLEALARTGGGEPATGGGPSRVQATTALHAFLLQGNQGRALVPVKRGARSEAFGPVAVDVDDRPGRLAALLTAAGEAGVNVEDVRVEHVPGRPRGLIELLVATDSVELLSAALSRQGWDVRQAQFP